MCDVAVVEIRPLDATDTDLVLRWRSDPIVARELFSPAPPTREDHIAWLATLGTRRKEFIVLALPERVPIGTVGLSHIDMHHSNAEIGVLIGESEYRGRGYGRAAVATLLAFAFDSLGLHRVTLRALDGNAKAIRMYERMGFRHEGRQKEQARRDGVYRDVVLMGLLEGEWRSRK